jgi:signal transduction histidine kinase
MVVSASSDQPGNSLAYLPATPRQRRLVLVVAALQFVAFGVTAPFASTPLPRFDAFIPTLEGIIFVNDFITSILLFVQYSIVPSRAILALAAGYLFTALIVIPHALTFPGAFTSTGLLGAGLQSTTWLYAIWHIATPAFVLVYSSLNGSKPRGNERRGSTASTIGWCVLIAVSLVCGLTVLATAGERLLPVIFVDSTHAIPSRLTVLASGIVLVSLAALVLLWIRQRSLLDYWLMLVIGAFIYEQILTSALNSERFSLGFYAGRIFSLATSIFVLGLLLSEITWLYAHLARSNMMLGRERDNKLMSLEAMAASIAHEIKQPLTAITSNGSSALRFLGRTKPDLEEVRSGLNAIVSDGYRACEVLDSILAVFSGGELKKQPVSVNDVILGALRVLRRELDDHGVTTHTELTSELPLVLGHGGQLREVILILVNNAIDAMNAIAVRNRILRVRTDRNDRDGIVVTVRDSGPGIDSKRMDRIFDAFVTTKSHGLGLGLAICRTIVERHGGRISAASDGKTGAVFQVVLPIKPADDYCNTIEGKPEGRRKWPDRRL